MARKRMIDPSIWADDGFGKLSSDAQVMFIGLFSNADDEGRLPGDPKYLASVIFPFRGITTPKAHKILKEIKEKMKSVTFYQVESQSLIQLDKFLQYQSINKSTKSKYPQPPNTQNNTGELPIDYGSTTVRLPPNRREKKINGEHDFEKQAWVAANEVSEILRKGRTR
jgi:hypothetical protein